MITRLAKLIPVVASLFLLGCPPAARSPVTTDTKEKPEVTEDVKADAEVVAQCEGTLACPNEGVCKGKVLPKCVDGKWECDFAAVADYEEEEATCNGKDNDCDGVADEAETFADMKPADACPGGLQGVCAEASEKDIEVVCAKDDGNAWGFQCSFAKVLDYVPDERFNMNDRDLYCDGLDNDCDGDTDEFYLHMGELTAEEFGALSFEECPEFQGVCEIGVSEGNPQEDWAITGDVLFRCSEGVFQCAVAQVADYDAIEARCDSLDNDCDGKVDETLGAELSPCLSKGVCAGLTEALCVNGEWFCNYEEVLKAGNFQFNDPNACIGSLDPLCGAETLCDGLDNDCDGEVDEGLTWPPYPEKCDDNVDNNANGKTDCEETLCAQYHKSCQGSTPLEFVDCPILTDKIINGVKMKVPVLLANGLPKLPGVCRPDDVTGESPVHLECHSLEVANQPAGAIWRCNYNDVNAFLPDEKYTSGGDTSICDGLDNDCNGIVDDPGEIVVTDNLAATSCRFLGECASNAAAYCNAGGLRPGQWSCEYNTKGTNTVAVPETCNPDYSNCHWEELKCDGLDNDCDGLADEMLDGRKLEVDTACAAISGKGVCIPDLLNTKCMTVSPGERAFVCDTDAITLYQVSEDNDLTACDSKDNDCDGLIDENIAASAPSDIETYTAGCLYKGVCAQGTVCSCSNGIWIANYAQVANFGTGFNFKPPLSDTYIEVACDGKDNDCDGTVDEDLNADLVAAGVHNPKLKSGCSLKGVCEGSMKWGCSEGGWFCDPSAVTAYEPTETKCDVKDNDCDGLVDETLSDKGPNGANCKNQGVCGGPGVSAACVNGQYLCYYDAVVGYESGKETLCDGKDNDCDGTADDNEDLDWKAVNACNRKGVCSSDQLAALCQGNLGWNCLYSALTDYQPNPESRCDRKDNDCDGTTDEAACAVCQACTSPADCITGACNKTPTGADYCSSSATTCVYVDPYTGLCTTVANTTRVCGTTSKPYLCANGTWYGNIGDCSGVTPVCVQGECKACIPLDMKCDGNSIAKCASDGSGWNIQGTCTASQVCLGKGVCVTNDEIAVTATPNATLSDDYSPKVAGRKTGGFVVVYETDRATGGDATDVVLKLYNGNMQAVGGEVLVNTYNGGLQGDPDVAGFNSEAGGFVVVWESLEQDGASWGVYGQRFTEAGAKNGDAFLVNTTTVADQKRPAVAASSDGSFVVVWESSSGADADSYGVYGRRFDSNGVPSGNEFLLNTTQANTQTNAEICTRASSGWAASWSSVGQDATAGTYAAIAQFFNSSMTKVGAEMLLNTYTTSTQRNPVVAGFGAERAGFIASAWESDGQDGFVLGVYMQYYGTSGDPLLLTGETKVNTVVLGNQRDPAIVVLDNNGVVVVWESPNLSGDVAGTYGVAARLYDSTAQPINASEWLVNQTTADEQVNPDVAAIGDRGYVIVWSGYKQTPFANNIFARVFKAP